MAILLAAMKTLRRHMKRNKLSQVSLARELGVSQATVCQWLSGQKNPTLGNLGKLADFTGLTVDELLDRKAA
jgi:transcriptional regulator with XRE-family HTH domain